MVSIRPIISESPTKLTQLSPTCECNYQKTGPEASQESSQKIPYRRSRANRIYRSPFEHQKSPFSKIRCSITNQHLNSLNHELFILRLVDCIHFEVRVRSGRLHH